jgi:hypothetical protein
VINVSVIDQQGLPRPHPALLDTSLGSAQRNAPVYGEYTFLSRWIGHVCASLSAIPIPLTDRLADDRQHGHRSLHHTGHGDQVLHATVTDPVAIRLTEAINIHLAFRLPSPSHR